MQVADWGPSRPIWPICGADLAGGYPRQAWLGRTGAWTLSRSARRNESPSVVVARGCSCGDCPPPLPRGNGNARVRVMGYIKDRLLVEEVIIQNHAALTLTY